MNYLKSDIAIIKHPTPSRILSIEKFISTISLDRIVTNKAKFGKLCEVGCINYKKKYSCPPFSPAFDKFSCEFSFLNVFCYRVWLNQYSDATPYNRVRASNAVIKSLLDKELYGYIEDGFSVVGSGSCRACKPCGAKDNVKCKKPKKRIYSLESLGVDVGQLVQECFGFDLEWYKKGKAQQYTCVVGGVLQYNDSTR